MSIRALFQATMVEIPHRKSSILSCYRGLPEVHHGSDAGIEMMRD